MLRVYVRTALQPCRQTAISKYYSGGSLPKEHPSRTIAGQSQDNCVTTARTLWCKKNPITRFLAAGNQEHLPEIKNIYRKSRTFAGCMWRILTLNVNTTTVKINTITGKVIYIIHAHHLGKL